MITFADLDIEGRELTPAEMNKIHFETGRHSEVDANSSLSVS